MKASIRSYSNSRTERRWFLNLSTAMVDEIGSMRIVGCRFWTLHFSELETLFSASFHSSQRLCRPEPVLTAVTVAMNSGSTTTNDSPGDSIDAQFSSTSLNGDDLVDLPIAVDYELSMVRGSCVLEVPVACDLSCSWA